MAKTQWNRIDLSVNPEYYPTALSAVITKSGKRFKASDDNVIFTHILLGFYFYKIVYVPDPRKTQLIGFCSRRACPFRKDENHGLSVCECGSVSSANELIICNFQGKCTNKSCSGLHATSSFVKNVSQLRLMAEPILPMGARVYLPYQFRDVVSDSKDPIWRFCAALRCVEEADGFGRMANRYLPDAVKEGEFENNVFPSSIFPFPDSA